MTNFMCDIKRGKMGEDMFSSQFLDFLGVRYINVSNCQSFQVQDIDVDTSIGTYEIKRSYKNDRKICIEEYTNVNRNLGNISQGWFYKTKADLLVFLSIKTGVMVLLPMTDEFKDHYGAIKDDYDLRWNRITHHEGRKWQSAYRRISLSSIEGFYAFYKKSTPEL